MMKMLLRHFPRTCDVLHAWAEWLQTGGKVTDRKQLLFLSYRAEGDGCDAFQAGLPGKGDCETDGHYLCGECLHMCHEAAVARGILRSSDTPEQGPLFGGGK